MYKHTIEPFGKFEKHTIENEQGDSFSIVPAFGANLLDLKFNNMSVLDGYQTPEELVKNSWSKNIVLFPFPNRLRDGQYTHEGVTYQFDINNSDTQNAIHGFSKDMPMTVLNTQTDAHEGSITCEYQHDGSHKAYPFKFIFKITFSLKSQNETETELSLRAERGRRGYEFEIDMQFKNLEIKAIPVGLGWHPYFRISQKSDDTALQMPDCQLIMIDDRMLPTGEKRIFKDFETLKKIGSTFLDNGFYIINQNENAEVILQSELGKLTYWQETGAAKWNYVQVFTPPHRQSIAVEPMTCNMDAFNNKDSLVLLTPKATLDGKFGVRFSK